MRKQKSRRPCADYGDLSAHARLPIIDSNDENDSRRIPQYAAMRF
jgi:hypothetical protein